LLKVGSRKAWLVYGHGPCGARQLATAVGHNPGEELLQGPLVVLFTSVAVHGAGHRRGEIVGPFERDGWNVAAGLTPIAYIAWSLWLVATDLAMLL
jgi:hypothetical protein